MKLNNADFMFPELFAGALVDRGLLSLRQSYFLIALHSACLDKCAEFEQTYNYSGLVLQVYLTYRTKYGEIVLDSDLEDLDLLTGKVKAFNFMSARFRTFTNMISKRNNYGLGCDAACPFSDMKYQHIFSSVGIVTNGHMHWIAPLKECTPLAQKYYRSNLKAALSKSST